MDETLSRMTDDFEEASRQCKRDAREIVGELSTSLTPSLARYARTRIFTALMKTYHHGATEALDRAISFHTGGKRP